ncbi:MAG: pyruvate dehydrogenase (acetyl-transferring) E1 component subunit alpha [Planctomycetota bacterium]
MRLPASSATGDKPASLDAKQAELLKELWKTIVLCRRFEEAAAKAYGMGKIGGFCHLYIGQEAVGVGAISALEKDDYIVTTYRDHAQFLARGGSVKKAMAELFGRAGGCSKGLGGSMHFFDVEKGFLGGWGIVGNHIPLAVGTAFKAKYAGEKRVALVFFGEGATAQGGFHEAMSLASLWRLPIVFVCENNHYAMGTPIDREVPVDDLTKLASAYDMQRDRLEDTRDVLEVRGRMQKAFDRARRGEGPTFIEAITYRYRGHSMSDPAKYRTKEEVEAWKAHDPLLVGRKRLEASGVSAKELDGIEAWAEKEIDDAVAWADAQPEPVWDDVVGNTYAEPVPLLDAGGKR